MIHMNFTRQHPLCPGCAQNSLPATLPDTNPSVTGTKVPKQ